MLHRIIMYVRGNVFMFLKEGGSRVSATRDSNESLFGY